jgi:nicotinic acid phosphoribosyltransferase
MAEAAGIHVEELGLFTDLYQWTMAQSYLEHAKNRPATFVESFTDELEAFRAFAVSYPEHTVLLIDTYDTVLGAVRAALVGQEMAHRGQHLRGVRLDSGDMTA